VQGWLKPHKKAQTAINKPDISEKPAAKHERGLEALAGLQLPKSNGPLHFQN